MNEIEQKRIFDEWFERHRGVLFKIVRAYSPDEHDREDLFQEITIKLWSSIPNFRGECEATTWIYRVALYAASSWSRREKKHRDGKASVDQVRPVLLASRSKANSSRLDWLYEQIGQLNEIDRSLTLLLLDGFQYKEMAQVIGISESNVGVKIGRIKKLLTEKLNEGVNYGL